MSAEVLSARSGWRNSLLRGVNSMRAFNFRLSELPTHVRLLLVAEIGWITLVVAMLTLAILLSGSHGIVGFFADDAVASRAPVGVATPLVAGSRNGVTSDVTGTSPSFQSFNVRQQATKSAGPSVQAFWVVVTARSGRGASRRIRSRRWACSRLRANPRMRPSMK